MKKSAGVIATALGAAMLVQGCYGNFALTRKLYAWNGNLGDKWISSLATWALLIVPIYQIAGVADFLVLNTIQFWSGSNPVTLGEGETQSQVIDYGGRGYRLTATRNRLEAEPLDGRSPGASLVFDPAARAWSAESGPESRRIIELVGPGDQVADLIYPDGSRTRIDLSAR